MPRKGVYSSRVGSQPRVLRTEDLQITMKRDIEKKCKISSEDTNPEMIITTGRGMPGKKIRTDTTDGETILADSSYQDRNLSNMQIKFHTALYAF